MWGCDAGVDARCLALSYLINDLFLNFTHPPSPIIPLMVFSSSIFLFAFLPLFLAVYFLMPKRAAKNIVLLAFSLLFYAWGEPVYVWLMVFSIVFNWAFGYAISAISRRGGGSQQKAAARP